MSYRPITDVWIMGRCKHKYYGGYPAGFLHRARQLLGVHPKDAVLHVCSGGIRNYPYRGFGPNDKTLDLDPANSPDYVQDARKPFPLPGPDAFWPAILIDRPYTEDDADHYMPGRAFLPTANELIRNGIKAVDVGGCVGILDYLWPQPPKNAKELATIAVINGRNNRIRQFTVFERME